MGKRTGLKRGRHARNDGVESASFAGSARRWTDMRRRRRFKGTWLPNLGSTSETVNSASTRQMAVDIPTSGDAAIGVTPIVFDAPEEAEFEPSSLGMGNLLGNEYALRRIVGKCFINFRDTFIGGDPSGFCGAAVVTSGFFVARAGDENDTDNVDFPIGGQASLQNNYRPAGLNTIREPWIWRRQWILGNPGLALWSYEGPDQVIPLTSQAASFPWSTAQAGSVLDGPHIDAKTRRNVTSDDRLWWAVEVRTFPFGTTFANGAPFVFAHLDYRVFGQLRRAKNRGNF